MHFGIYSFHMKGNDGHVTKQINSSDLHKNTLTKPPPERQVQRRKLVYPAPQRELCFRSGRLRVYRHSPEGEKSSVHRRQYSLLFDLVPGLVTQKTFKISLCALATTDGSEHMYKQFGLLCRSPLFVHGVSYLGRGRWGPTANFLELTKNPLLMRTDTSFWWCLAAWGGPCNFVTSRCYRECWAYVIPLPSNIFNPHCPLPPFPSKPSPYPGLSLQQIRGYLLFILLEDNF